MSRKFASRTRKFQEIDLSNRRARSFVVLELYHVEFVKRLFLTQKWHFPTYLSLHIKRIEHLIRKFVRRTRKLQEIESFKLQCEILCCYKVMLRWICKKALFYSKNDTFLHMHDFILNGSRIWFENLFIELESFKESNAWNQSADSCVVFEICLLEFVKRLFLDSKMIPSYIFIPRH